MFFLVAMPAFFQIDGDYLNKQAGGDWLDIITREYWNGSAWANITAKEGYPGGLADAGTVTILCDNTGVTITLDVTPDYSLASLILETSSVQEDKQLIFSGTNSLTVKGLIHLKRPFSGTDASKNIIEVGAGTFTTGSLEIGTSGGAYTNVLKSIVIISSGTVTVNGDIYFRMAGWTTFVRFTGDGILNLGGGFTAANTGGTVKITSEANGSLTAGPTSGTVHFNASGNQAVWGQPYHNLKVSGTTGAIKTLNQLNVNTPPSVSSNLHTDDCILALGSGTVNMTIKNGATLTAEVGSFGSDQYIRVVGNGYNYDCSSYSLGDRTLYNYVGKAVAETTTWDYSA